MSHNDYIDETVLNVLLAEGVDFPTAYQASRVDVAPDDEAHHAALPRESSGRAFRYIAFVLVAIVIIVVLAIF